jgi:hypothetical protein
MNEHTKTAWIINGLLAVILVLLAGSYWNLSSPPAYAGPGWDTDGIMAASALDSDRIVLIDTKNKTVLLYNTNGNQFRLVGARSFEYDVEVEDSAGTPIEKGTGMRWFDMYQLYQNKEKKAP